MPYYGVAPTPPRAWEFWVATKARLNTVLMQTILGGAGRVKIETEDLTPPAAENVVWGRIVIAPVRRFYGEPDDEPGRRRMTPFLVRAEIHSTGGAYQPAIALEAAQNEAFAALHGWTPTGMVLARAVGPVERITPPQSLPLWDESSGLWFLSSEYRAVLAPAT